jgi:hypothetical protein
LASITVSGAETVAHPFPASAAADVAEEADDDPLEALDSAGLSDELPHPASTTAETIPATRSAAWRGERARGRGDTERREDTLITL